MYLGFFAAEENVAGDNPPIGIILTRHKDELLVEYATYQMNSQLFVQKYQLYLPNREELRRELERTLALADERGLAASYDNSISRSSVVRSFNTLPSASRIASAKSRFLRCRSRIFSSTVSRQMRR